MGLPIESLNTIMLNVGLERTDGDWNWQQVSSPFTRIYCVTEGEARLHLPDKTQELTPGHLYIIPAHITHSYECHGRFTHYYLHVYEGFKKETDIFELYDFPTEVNAQEGDEQIFAAMCRQYPEAQLPASDPESYDNTGKFTDYVKRYNDLPIHQKMWLRGCILILISRFIERAALRTWTKDDRVAQVLTYIHKNIYDDIDIDDLADVACVTKPYLIRLFKRSVQVSPLQYINRKKIEKAELLLLTEDLSIKELAYTLGFGDHSYFIRLFKKITGKTPQEYRETIG